MLWLDAKYLRVYFILNFKYRNYHKESPSQPKGKYQSIGLGQDDFWAQGRTIYSLNGILE